MNNTLTGLGLALVLALIAALIGPWFVNWTAYRDAFAGQASAIVGAPVKLTGAVDARLLPTPYVRFRGLTSGAGATRLTVDEVEIELAMAPLFRGEFKAERLKLVRPRVGVELLADGTVRTAFSAAAKGKPAPERASFDRAEIADGALTVATPAGGVVIERVSGLAEAGSLAGPFKFEGAGTLGGDRLKVRLATTRADDKGAMRAKLAVEREGRGESFEADGALTVAARPAFEGKVALARVLPRTSKGSESPTGQAEPWRIAADAKADGARLRLDNLDVAYGPDERAVRLGGRGEIRLAAQPSFDLTLQSRQVDLDRIAGAARPKTPAAMIANLSSQAGFAIRPRVAGRLALDLKGVVLAGDVMQDLRADLSAEGTGWRVGSASATLPGETKVKASGAVAFADDAPGFAGKVDFSTVDLGGLRRWLAGGEEQPDAPVRRLAVKGDVKAGSGSVSIEDAELAADGARSTGRVAWRAGGRDRFEAALVSEKLDLDVFGVDRLLGHALRGGRTDVALALDAKTLTLAGVQMNDVSIDGALDEEGVDLKRLDVRDMGGAEVSGAGRIAAGAAGPEGELGFKVAAERLQSLLTLARAAGAPEAVLAALEPRAAALAPVRLDLTVAADAKGRRLTVSGDAGGGRLDARASAAEVSSEVPAEIELRLASPDGRRLAALGGIELSPAIEAAGGEISLRLSGAPARGMKGEAKVAALGVVAEGRGALAVAPVVGVSAEGDVTLVSDDLTLLAEAVGRLTPGTAPRLPAALKGRMALSAEGVRFEQVSGALAGNPLRGRVTLPSDPARPIEGALELEEFSAAAFAALALSPDALGAGADRRGLWPTAAFGASPVRGLLGRFDVKAARAPLAGGQVATEASFTLAFRRNAAAIEQLSAALDGGRLTGSATVTRTERDATLGLAMTLEGARAERLTGLAGPAAPVVGLVDVRAEAQGTGRTLGALVGALTGAGTLTLRDGAVRRLDVAAIDGVEPQVEAGLALEAPKVADALGRGLGRDDLKLDRAVAPFTISGGVLRTGGISAENPSARLGGGGTLDLRRLVLDADLTLQPNRPEAPQIGLSFEGPLASPARRIDATAFTGWLSVRAVERETKRIEAMEADIRDRAKIARERAEEERKRAEAEKKRLDEERRKAEADRRKRDAEARALIDTLPRPTPSTAPGLPAALDISPPADSGHPARATPPGGVFEGLGQGRGSGRTPQSDPLGPPLQILPPGATAPSGR